MLPSSFLTAPIAHRALHDRDAGRPENSVEAVRAAIAGGYGIEIDLQLSSDGQAMVFHDYDLGRLTAQTGPLRQRSAAELGAIPLLGGETGIPRFEEVLALVAGQVPLLIEIKDQDGALGAAIGRLEEATAKALAGYRGPAAVMSFNPNSTRIMAGLAPNVPRGITTCSYDPADWPLLPAGTRDRLRDIPDIDAAQAHFISHEWTDLDRPRVVALREQGLPVFCWTIRSAAQEAEARKSADAVTFETYLPHLDT
ncbi:glycerophosphodiester phosphodiesterase family protein [Pseudooceanicola sp. C21-150M6]|uniref:glycerophosphodiester phosphodiesterase family protein n=1 Tax=Pseudooceanicola sp. C21-150M6 TaxID=3434355 RepID=UPI003D7FB600